MIKVQNNIATSEPIPPFLIGLAPESLADLSWTDPALGVSDCAWWPEVDQSPALGEYERYGTPQFAIDAANKRVIVTRAVEPWSADEIAADKKAKVPQACSARQARLALLQSGLLDAVEAEIAGMSRAAQIEWEFASEIVRQNTLITESQAALSLTDEQIDNLFSLAATL